MMIPKSMAPMESRLAGTPRPCRKNESEQQAERNGERHNDRRAHAHQKENQHDQDQDHAAFEVVLDRVDGELHQVAAVVERMDLHVRRQNAIVEFLGLLFHARQDVLGLLAGQHEDDAFDPVIVLLEAEFAQARRVADGDFADVADAHGHAVVVAHDDVADVLGLVHQARGRARKKTASPANKIRRRRWRYWRPAR